MTLIGTISLIVSAMEAFAAKREKSVFRNLFGAGSGSDSSDSCDEDNNPAVAVITLSDDGEPTIGEGGIDNITTFISPSGLVTTKMIEEKALGIAHQLWPAAKFMCNYIESNHKDVLNASHSSINILELGAGVGLCGLFVSSLIKVQHQDKKQNIIVTDLSEAIDRLNKNIELNDLGDTVSAQVLSWGVESELDEVFARFNSPPLVIAADCVYWECLFQPLFSTLQALTNRGCEVVIAHVKRWKKDAKFFALCRKGGMAVEVLVEAVEMVPAEHTGIPARQITRVYRITKQQ